jgi:magnesium transporter
METMTQLNTWRVLLPEIIELLQEDPREIPEALSDLHPADVGEIINHLPAELIPRFLNAFPTSKAADFFEYTSEPLRLEVIPLMDLATAAALLDAMEPDEQADIVSKLPEELQQDLLQRLTPANKQEALQILQFPENTAGRIMTTEYIAVAPTSTVREALEAVKTGLPTRENYHHVYVQEGMMLKGVLSIRDLLLANENDSIESVMNPQVITVLPEADQEQAARLLSRYDLISVPVVTEAGTMIGVVTVDDVIDVLVEEQTEDVQKLGAVEPFEYPYFQTSFWTIIRKRAVWLILLFIAEFLTGYALRHYDEALKHAISLVFFIPLIISSGGNSGSQSATIITRALATGDIQFSNFFSVMWRESLSGVVMGLILGAIGFGRAFFWDTGIPISIIVGLTLLGVVMVGTVVGAVLPLLLKRAGFDPAVSSAPAIASLVDVCGILIYFNIAQLFLTPK